MPFRRELAVRLDSIVTTVLVLFCTLLMATAHAQSIERLSSDRAGDPRLQRPGPFGYPRPTAFLERVWPDYPEALAMFAELATGNRVTRETGWFKKGIAETRFDWTFVTEKYDRNRNRRIERGEFTGTAAEFERLDRDFNGILTWTDITPLSNDPRANQLADEFGLEAFRYTDRSGNGKGDPIEVEYMLEEARKPSEYYHILQSVRGLLEKRYQRVTRDGKAFLTLADFQEVFDIAALLGTLPKAPIKAVPSYPARQEVLLRAFFRRELGHWSSGPSLDDLAPDFTLKTADGKTEVTLSKAHDSKPLVLIFGNITCGELRNHLGSLEVLMDTHKDRANFLLVYTRETHPKGGWEIDGNNFTNVEMVQPRDYAGRAAAATMCRRLVPLNVPVLVDTIDDQVSRAYSAMPIRLYLIDRQGKIAYKSGRGPYGFKPAELEKALILLGEAERSESISSATQTSPK